MESLIAAAAAFVLLHLLISGTPIRDALVRVLGQGAYMGLFSLASLACLAWLGFGYAAAKTATWNATYWDATPITRHVQLGLQVLAMLLILPGLMTPNPTSVRQEGALDRPDVIKGMLRITRHPFLWGVAIWAGGHLLVNGDRASIILFGSMAILAVFGTASIDAKRKRALGDKWTGFAAQTSNLPFGAILTGRQGLKLGEIGLVRIVVALGAYAAIAHFHAYIAGVPAIG